MYFLTSLVIKLLILKLRKVFYKEDFPVFLFAKIMD